MYAVHSHDDSMDLTSTYSEPGSVLANDLTPRSKVAKMLAEIDNESTPSPPDSPVARVADVVYDRVREDRPALRTHSESLSSKRRQRAKSEHSEEDSDGDIRRPQGRAARRMQAVRPPLESAGSPHATHSERPPVDNEDELYTSTPVRSNGGLQDVLNSMSPLSTSNGLFVSPAGPSHPMPNVEEESEDELPSNPFGSKGRLAALVADRRAYRLAGEVQERESLDTLASSSTFSDHVDAEMEDQGNARMPDVERIMSDASRPARKASKRALLEMERETQRLARQQALAHQMKAKKKFTTEDLFKRFKMGHSRTDANSVIEQPPHHDSTPSSAPNSDGVESIPREPVSTPPSSPPTPFDKQKMLVDQGALSKLVSVERNSVAHLAELDTDDELPPLTDMLAFQEKNEDQSATPNADQPTRRGRKLTRLMCVSNLRADDDSDDDLEVVRTLPAHLRAFEKAMGVARANRPADSNAIHVLKHLSRFNMHESTNAKKGARRSVNPKSLEAQLRRKAKELARQQEVERLEELKAKGVVILNPEEREKEAEDFETLLEKARQQAQELRKAEATASKRSGVEADQMASDDEEDADYDDSASELEEEEPDDVDVTKVAKDEHSWVEEMAEETDEEDGDELDSELESDEVPSVARDGTSKQVSENLLGEHEDHASSWKQETSPPVPVARRARNHRVVEDDETDDDTSADPLATQCPSGGHEEGEKEDPFAAFNFGAAEGVNALLSPTQLFNATMQTPTQATQEVSLDILRRIAPPSTSSLPDTMPIPADATPSQRRGSNSQFLLMPALGLEWGMQTPETPASRTSQRDLSNLTETPDWQPTQDAGLPSPSVFRREAVPAGPEHETQSTVHLRVSESPVRSQDAPRRGKLVRRQAALPEYDDNDAPPPATLRPDQRDAFREMAKRRKEALNTAERAEAEREMRHMMDEQAEESDDEYAGLGGDDFVAPETEEDREMIDTSHIEVDERALAAHFAERERQRNEEETNKLYKDITTGVLRRKMGANAFDLDEDEDELAVRRRQMRQQEEARKRKALLKDDKIASLAEGKQSKGKDAFLKAIADDDGGDDEVIHESDEDVEIVLATQEESQQSQTRQPNAPPLQETSGSKRRPAIDDGLREHRAPAKQRRTGMSAFKRPTSLLEVKQSVSFLLDEPDAAIANSSGMDANSDSDPQICDPDSEASDEVDDEALALEEARQNDGGIAPNPVSREAKAVMLPPRLPASQRRTPAKPDVVDRLSLKRGASSNDSALGRTAWAAGPNTQGFKVPSLLRRATTNSGASSANDRGVSTPNLSRENSSGAVKMGGSKKSSLAYQARAEERRAIVEASAKRREENTKRIAQLRRNSSALSRGLTGRFE